MRVHGEKNQKPETENATTRKTAAKDHVTAATIVNNAPSRRPAMPETLLLPSKTEFRNQKMRSENLRPTGSKRLALRRYATTSKH